MVVLFTIWDIAGILAGHWSYNPLFVTGVHLLLGMPLEELVFFIVVPICGTVDVRGGRDHAPPARPTPAATAAVTPEARERDA